MTAKPMPDAAAPAKPFSYSIPVDEVPEGGLDVSIAADAAALRALAAVDELPNVASLNADFHVVRTSGGRFNVSGEMRARVTQLCVVSLEPFESDIAEPIDVDFILPPDAKPAHGAASPGFDSDAGADLSMERDPPDVIVDGKIDLGALAAEFMALGLDPYPKKPGVVFEPPNSPDEDASNSPFGILRNLKDHS
jgi:hypothetical protein